MFKRLMLVGLALAGPALTACGPGGESSSGGSSGGAVAAVTIANQSPWDVNVAFSHQHVGGPGTYSVNVPTGQAVSVSAEDMPNGAWRWWAKTKNEGGISPPASQTPCGTPGCIIDGFGEIIFVFADRSAPYPLTVTVN